jgi:hypothetical protein
LLLVVGKSGSGGGCSLSSSCAVLVLGEFGGDDSTNNRVLAEAVEAAFQEAGTKADTMMDEYCSETNSAAIRAFEDMEKNMILFLEVAVLPIRRFMIKIEWEIRQFDLKFFSFLPWS